jgi:hypothetical protein
MIILQDVAVRKAPLSLAYTKILCPLPAPIKSCKDPCSETFITREFRTPITRMNSTEEREDPPAAGPSGGKLGH